MVCWCVCSLTRFSPKCRVLPSFTGFHRVSPSFTGFNPPVRRQPKEPRPEPSPEPGPVQKETNLRVKQRIKINSPPSWISSAAPTPQMFGFRAEAAVLVSAAAIGRERGRGGTSRATHFRFRPPLRKPWRVLELVISGMMTLFLRING